MLVDAIACPTLRISMRKARRIAGGVVVFPALQLSEGPSPEWIAIALDRRLLEERFAVGRGPTAHAAEFEALAKLGASPNTMRAALASTDECADPAPTEEEGGGNSN
jgi:hypothetical protein